MAGISASRRKDLAVFLGSDFLNQDTCQPCNAEGKKNEAIGFCTNCQEHLCEECFEYHTKPTPTKHHVLIRQQQTLKHTRKSILKKTSFSFKNRLPDKCPEHLDKTIKYFCQEHEYLGCSVCMTLNHRHCNGMEYIPDASVEIASSEEYKDFDNKIKQTAEDSNKIMQDIKERSAEAEHYHSDALAAVKKYREDINDVLNQIENDITEKLKQVKEEEMHELNEAAKICADTIKEANTISKQFQTLNANKQKCSMYIALKRAKARLRVLENDLHSAQTEAQNAKKATRYIFKPTNEILKHLKSFKTLGTLCVHDTKVNSLADINVRSDSDTTQCWVSGMAVLPKNKLVVADRNNRKIKLLDTEENSILSEAQLEARPWDVAKVSDTHVVVSLPNRKRLVFMNTDPNLSTDHELAMKEPCYGVAHGDGSLIVTFAGEHKVELFDLEGHLLKSFGKKENGHQIFFTPCYVAVSPEQQMIYISNSGNDSLVCLRLDGTIVGTFKDKDLKFLRQSVVDEHGMVYVCEASGNIHQITTDCKKVKSLIPDNDGKFLPFSIDYDESAKQLLVGMENQDAVKVYQVKHATL